MENMGFGIVISCSGSENTATQINIVINSLERLTQTAEGASSSLSSMASLSALSVTSGRLGQMFTDVGSSILGVFTNLVNSARDTGSEFESFRVTLNALYGDAEKAETAIGKLLDFSVKSPFEVSGVKDMLIVLQSQGIDAFKEIQGSLSDTRQETLAWVADLMSFKPDEATTRWKRALTNYIGSGEVRMLRNILDMGDIDQILGHDVGATVEERMNDIIEIVEKKNLTGLSQNLATTLKGAMSNVADAFTKLYKSIADNGVFDNLKTSFLSLSGAILTLEDDKIEALGKTLADGINLVLVPITKIVKKINGFIMKLIELCETSPNLVKFGLVLVAVVGSVLLAIGAFLKLTSAFSGFSLMMIASGRDFKSFGKLFTSGVKLITKKLIPLIILFGALRFAWKNDIAGIKTMTTKFVSNLSESFKTANKAVNGSVEDLIDTLTALDQKDDFFSNLTRGIIEVKMTMKALADAWPDYTLSEENFKKAEELGILPLIEKILDLKYRFGFFKKGFIDGWNEIGAKIKKIGKSIVKNVEGTFLEDMIDGLTKFFKLLTDNDPKAWEEAGNKVAKFSGALLGLFLVVKLFKGIGKIFGKNGIGGAIGSILGKKKGSKGASGGDGGILTNPVQVLKMMGSIAIILGGVALLITALGALKSIPGFDDFISGGAEVIATMFNSLIPIAGSVFVLGLLIKALDMLKIDPMTALKGIANFAIILGGLELLMVAIGAIASIPSFSGFISTGAEVMGKIADVLSKICDLKVIIAIGLISAFGLIPIPVVLLGLANLALVLGGITALILAFGALSKIDGFNDFIRNGGDTLALLFEQIGKIAGSLIGGIGEGLTNSLPTIGDNLSKFADKLSPFLDMIKYSPSATTIKDFVKAFVYFLKEMVGEKSRSKKVKEIGENLEGFTSILKDMVTVMSGSINSLNTFTVGFGVMASGVSLNSETIKSKIIDMLVSVSSNLDKLSNKFKGLKLELPKIKVPHFSIVGDFDVETKKVPKVDVKWYETGGVFNSPSIIGVGENGQEAVMPLEKNIGWIGKLAGMITSEMYNIVPTNSSQQISATNSGGSDSGYMTRNTSNTTIHGDTDNSVTFSEGAIQLNVQNASEEEAMRLAKKVMEYIKRQQQLDKMLAYG